LVRFFSHFLFGPDKTYLMITRDGTCVSLWQDSVQQYTPVNKPDNSFTYDVAIAGGGITGISTALLLQEAGEKCILFEANTLCFGTTSGTTAHLNTLLDTPYTTIAKNFGEENAKLVAEAAGDSISLVKKNIKKYAIDCDLEEVPAYLFSQNQKQTEDLEEIFEASSKAGLDIAYSKSIPVPMPFNKAFRVEKQAKFHPLKYVYGLAKAFEEAGGVIVQQSRVLNLEGDEPIRVETSTGNYTAGAVVYATHIPMGINLLHLRCAPYRSYAMAVRLKSEEEYPDALAYDSFDPYHYYRTHIVKGKKYLIAGGEDHKTAHEENTEKCFRELEAHVRKYFTVKDIAYRWSSQYYEPADGLPYIGHLPGHPGNIYVATGFGGNGMTYSGVSAILLRDMLQGVSNKYTDLFDPNRVKPVAGFVNFIKHNAGVAKELFSKLLPAEKLHDLAELAPGEGKVIKYENETIALYKDTEGNLHAINPSCTHMKCSVAWNLAEQSWDCPCHGARYSADGKVLNGPADIDLAYIPVASLVEEHQS
jgi:glycine/D-amino acid oxidase-like deaminating enzyme/nitrite reductase/ring-hydroxylating ferredoxin subunit